MKSRFWMVYGFNQGAPAFRHQSEQNAITEAKRLARITPNVEFFVLETTHHVVKRDVDVTRMSDDNCVDPSIDDVPF